MSRAVAGYLIACVLCGCWRGSGETGAEEPASPPVKGASCDEAAGNAHDVIVKANDRELAARAVPLRAIVQRRCETDAWSMELRRCVAGATSVDDASTCDKLATQRQRDALSHELELMIVTEDGQ